MWDDIYLNAGDIVVFGHDGPRSLNTACLITFGVVDRVSGEYCSVVWYPAECQEPSHNFSNRRVFAWSWKRFITCVLRSEEP